MSLNKINILSVVTSPYAMPVYGIIYASNFVADYLQIFECKVELTIRICFFSILVPTLIKVFGRNYKPLDNKKPEKEDYYLLAIYLSLFVFYHILSSIGLKIFNYVNIVFIVMILFYIFQKKYSILDVSSLYCGGLACVFVFFSWLFRNDVFYPFLFILLLFSSGAYLRMDTEKIPYTKLLLSLVFGWFISNLTLVFYYIFSLN